MSQRATYNDLHRSTHLLSAESKHLFLAMAVRRLPLVSIILRVLELALLHNLEVKHSSWEHEASITLSNKVAEEFYSSQGTFVQVSSTIVSSLTLITRLFATAWKLTDLIPTRGIVVGRALIVIPESTLVDK